jgi:outer membrane protein assembly factor BamD (BamD/ComL family)
MKKYIILLLALCLAITIFTACKTIPDPEEIEKDLTPAELFQLAQEEVIERNNYKAAMVYYQTFLQRYPDDIQGQVIAEYEIAFLYHKMGEDETAIKLFEALLDKYEGPNADVLPQWPEVLSRKVLTLIREEMEEQGGQGQEQQPANEAG